MVKNFFVIIVFLISSAVAKAQESYHIDCGALESHEFPEWARRISQSSCELNCNSQIDECTMADQGELVDFIACRPLHEYITPDPRTQRPVYWVSTRGEGTCVRKNQN